LWKIFTHVARNHVLEKIHHDFCIWSSAFFVTSLLHGWVAPLVPTRAFRLVQTICCILVFHFSKLDRSIKICGGRCRLPNPSWVWVDFVRLVFRKLLYIPWASLHEWRCLDFVSKYEIVPQFH
jgi:hypothetical protein